MTGRPGPKKAAGKRRPKKRQCVWIHKEGHAKAGERCELPPVKGSTVCHKHGGKAPQIKAAGKRREQTALAVEACETLGIPHDGITPEQALLAELWECLGNIDFYRRQVQRLPPAPEPDTFVEGEDGADGHWERGATGVYGRVYHVSGIPTGEAKPHVLVVLYERERDRLRQIAGEMLRAGVEERRVQLAEADAALVFSGINAALAAMGLEERLEEFRRHFAEALSHGHRALPRRAAGAR